MKIKNSVKGSVKKSSAKESRSESEFNIYTDWLRIVTIDALNSLKK